jgi:predicted transcriptional regulator
MINVVSKLKNLDLSEKEAMVFLDLNEFPESKTGSICSRTTIPSSHIYKILETLISRGLVSYKIVNNVKHYFASDPEFLSEVFEQKVQRLRNEKKEVLEVIQNENLDFRVMLGAYIGAEMNNFGCPWGGSYSEEVVAKDFQSLKTFGLGKDTTVFAWQLYIQQLIQQGAIEIDYRDLNKLKLTSLSNEILFKNKSVKLVSFETIKARQEEQKILVKKAKESEAIKKATDHNEPFDEQVFQSLRALIQNIMIKLLLNVFAVLR